MQFAWCYWKTPNNIGFVLPSSEKVSRTVVNNIQNPEESLVVEIGAGTGVITSHIIQKGVLAKNLYVVEYDSNLFKILEKKFPMLDHLYNIDAANLSSTLPKDIIGQVDYVISTIPLLLLPLEKCQEILKEAKRVLKPNGVFLQVTLTPFVPKYIKELGMKAKRAGVCCANIPPAFVWRYFL